MVFTGVASGHGVDSKDILSQFNAEELTEIIAFSQSDSLAAMKKALPVINRDLSEAGRRLGEWITSKQVAKFNVPLHSINIT